MNKSLVSIIIPTYNRRSELEKAIKSVLNQTYKEYEIIVVDNGSTDGTIDFLETMIKKENNLYYYINPIKGANYSRNLGIKKSQGIYLAFLDDDDTWHKTKLEKQVEILDNNLKIGLCYTGKNIIYKNFNLKYISYSTKENIYITNYVGTTSSVILRKNILQKSGLFDTSLPAIQDYDLWIRILMHTKSYQVKEPLINYYISINNNQISNSVKKYKKAISIIDEKYKNCKEYQRYNKIRDEIREKNLIFRAIRGNESLSIKDLYRIRNKVLYVLLKIFGLKWILYLKKWRINNVG